jgi:putative endopeptidase
MITKRNSLYKKKFAIKNKTRKKKLQIVKIDKNNIQKINQVYQEASLYKNNEQYKKVNGKNVNKIIDEKVKHLLKLFEDERIQNLSPKEDFHQVTNVSWINDMKKKKSNSTAYYTQFDNFRVVQDKVYYRLIQYVEDYIKQNNNRFSTCLKNVYHSWKYLNSKTIEQHFHQCVQQIEFYQTDKSKNVWQFLGKLNENELIAHSLPFQWTLAEDKKNTKIFANYISSPKLGLYDLDIYFDSKRKEDQKKYIAFINQVFDACFKTKSHHFRGEDVFEIECTIVESFGCKTNNLKTDENNYNKIISSQNKTNFDWKQFAVALGYKKIPSYFICNHLNYLTCMSETLINNWRNEKWKSYWVFIHLVQMIRFHPKLRVLYYEYYEKELFGQNALFPDEIYPVFGLSITFHEFLTKEYRKHNTKQEYIDYTKRMASNMRQLLLERLKKNKWLTPTTKAFASKKIQKINVCIDSCTTTLSKDPLLDYNINDAWENMQKIFHHRRQMFLKCSGGFTKNMEFSQVDWKSFKLTGTQTYIVNAFYIPSFNRIFIPLGYLQQPFIDLDDRGIEYNLANIGFILAHEFSHSLDAVGSKYDQDGNLYDWWTEVDKKRYKKIMDDINNQYTKAMSHQKLKTDVSFLLNENIADITGLSLCSDYLILYHSVKQNLESVSTTFLSLKTFYNFYAIQMRQHVETSSIEMMSKTNPHSMDKYRINCPLSRLYLFQKIFDIQPKNNMYWDTNKISVW